MSRLGMTGWAVAAGLILAGSQSVMAEGLTEEQRADVENIVANKIESAKQELIAVIRETRTAPNQSFTGQPSVSSESESRNDRRRPAPSAGARPAPPRSGRPAPPAGIRPGAPPHSGHLPLPAGAHPAPGRHPALGASLHLLQDILHEQELCEDREKVGRALKYLINGSGCSKCGKSDCGHYGLGFYPGNCNYYRPDGSIDFARLIDCEVKRQDLIEEREKLGRALKYLIKDDCNSCTPKCETSCTESTSYWSPSRSSVVVQSPVSYYRYVNCE